MFRPVDEQESRGSTQAFQPFAAGVRSDPPAPCLLSLGVTAPEGPQDAALVSSSPANLQFGYLAVSPAKLLKTAKRELVRDREAAKASLAMASSILRSEVERRSRAQGRQTRRISGLADSARARFHRRESAPYHPYQGPQRRSEAKHSTFLAVLQTSLRRTTARLRGEETAGEGVSSADYQLGIAERNSPERRPFPSSTSVQTLQAGAWSKSIQLEARP